MTLLLTNDTPQPNCTVPNSQRPQPITLWQFVQGVGVVAALIVSLREISRR
jgi:hypothetical protein